jgi:hypothetical protein
MKKQPDHAEPRGARDLVALWGNLPVGMLRYPMAGLPEGLGLSQISDTLRKQAWRAHCAAGAKPACAEAGRACPLAGMGRCRADQLFPMHLGGGAPQWRMATLFIQYLPRAAELRLVALGDAACAELRWAGECLSGQHRLPEAHFADGCKKFADVVLAPCERWRLCFVTPWLVRKNGSEPSAMPDLLAEELGKSIRARAHKFSALCATEATAQRLAGHLAHYIADALLPAQLRIESARVNEETLPLASRGNGGAFAATAWSGEATLAISPALLPWLSLLALCGGGENADKGFGVVELTPLQYPSRL